MSEGSKHLINLRIHIYISLLQSNAECENDYSMRKETPLDGLGDHSIGMLENVSGDWRKETPC